MELENILLVYEILVYHMYMNEIVRPDWVMRIILAIDRLCAIILMWLSP